MLLKDDKLQAYAGLLNEKAPKDHFLAYITPSERDMLVDAGGKKTPTESGIFAYPPQDNYTSSYDSSQNQSGRNENTSGAGGGSGYQGSDNSHSRFDVGSGYYGEPTTTTTTSNNNDDIDSTYTSTSFDVTPEPVEKNFFEKVVDFVKGGGIIGSVIKSIGGKLNPENKYEGITGEDGYGEGDYISTQGDWAASKGFVDKAEDYYDLDLEEQQAIDKQMYDDGVRSQAFNDLYNDGNTSNLDNLTTTERNEINKIIPNLPDAIGGTTPQESMVNKYFNNNQTNTVSAGLLARYDQAKTDISARINSMNDNQFGLNRNGHTPFTQTNKTGNPFFIDYLKDQGLI